MIDLTRETSGEPSKPVLTPEQKADMRAIFEGKVPGKSACSSCGGLHLRACPRIKRIERHLDGTVLVEEYWPRGEWESDDIIWPEEAYEPDG